MNLNQPSERWRECGETMATHSHIFWQCPLLENIWQSVFAYINKVLNVELIRDPLIAILGMKPVVIHCRKDMYLLQILLVAANKTITIKWLEKIELNFKKYLHYGKITYSLIDTEGSQEPVQDYMIAL